MEVLRIVILYLVFAVVISGQGGNNDQHSALSDERFPEIMKYIRKFKLTCSDEDVDKTLRCGMLIYSEFIPMAEDLKGCEFNCSLFDKFAVCFNENLDPACLTSAKSNEHQLVIDLSSYLQHDDHTSKYIPKNCTKFYNMQTISDICPNHVPLVPMAPWSKINNSTKHQPGVPTNVLYNIGIPLGILATVGVIISTVLFIRMKKQRTGYNKIEQPI